jgi:hypothetical protein
MNDVIAERLYQITNDDGTAENGTLQIFRPFQDTALNNDWHCIAEVKIATHTRTEKGYGVDSLMALRMVLDKLKFYIDTLGTTYGPRLTCYGDEKLWF